ncbi:MAG TPA: biotin/lipoyl-containing protein, partial [Burkholderiales bacterium]|nr:biotin/lipoyl-containing protein [Burkholderiales bacterium]
MLIEVKVPQLSESVAEATLLSWHKQAGQYVNRDENLVDIETDKVVLETPAPEAGVLVKIVKGDGGTVTSNEVIAQIDTEAAKPAAAAPTASAPAAEKAPAAAPTKQGQPAKSGTAPAMPAAQKLAAETQVDTAAIAGTGRGGRVTKGDVLQALAGSPTTAAPAENEQGKPRFPPLPSSSTPTRIPAPAVSQRAPAPAVDLGALGDRPEQRVPMSRLRARIAERLVQSQATAAILT